MIAKAVIEKSTFDFLKKLAKNNDREWFNKHKDEYLEAKENAERFVGALMAKMNQHDQIETPSAKKSLWRIYNDVRFSSEKTPFSPRFGGYLRRLKPMLRGGYYYWITPGASRVGCGFVFPKPEDLKRIRQDIELNEEDWRKLLKTKSIRATFGEMRGDQVKTAPKGFAKNHPAIDLLRYKQFWFEKSFTDEMVLSPDFLEQVNKAFKSIRPFFDYMSDILTTDVNGEEL
jgi:uncharacterized protein (TIGR02453 family)